MDYEGKSVLILGGGDGGILNMLRTKHNPKVKLMQLMQLNYVVKITLVYGMPN